MGGLMNRSLGWSGVALLVLAAPTLAAGSNSDLKLDRESEVSSATAFWSSTLPTALPSGASETIATHEGPADTLYQAARRALNRGQYKQALALLEQLQLEEPDSEYAPEVMYWQAFALSKLGGRSNLEEASRLLNRQEQRYPGSSRSGDAEALATRVRTGLARQGDAASAEGISREARAIAEQQRQAARDQRSVQRDAAQAARDTARIGRDAARIARDQAREQRNQNRGQDAGEDEMKVAALNALMQVSPDKALPILKQVLANRDSNSEELRAKAMFIVSQIDSPETIDVMLDAVRNDPSLEVREKAVFWLSQVEDRRAFDALTEIVQNPGFSELHENAIFALSQSSDSRVEAVLRDYASDAGATTETRKKAIFWLGQQGTSESSIFLRELYGTIQDQESREQILFAVAQMSGQGSGAWLMERALDTNADIELRKKALFWAGQISEVDIARLTSLYGRTNDFEMKKQLIFVYSQRSDSEAIDKLVDIARTEEDTELRKKAVFWIGQSGDPRAEDILLEILTQE